MAKLGAMRTPTSGCAASGPRRVASFASSQPVVPTTTCTPALDAVRHVGRRGGRHGELHHDVGATEVTEVVALVEAPDQLEVRPRR